jgi:hypothetical protein
MKHGQQNIKFTNAKPVKQVYQQKPQRKTAQDQNIKLKSFWLAKPRSFVGGYQARKWR